MIVISCVIGTIIGWTIGQLLFNREKNKYKPSKTEYKVTNWHCLTSKDFDDKNK